MKKLLISIIGSFVLSLLGFGLSLLIGDRNINALLINSAAVWVVLFLVIYIYKWK